MQEKHKRRHYFTDVSLQLRYVFMNFLVLAIFLCFSLWVVYVTGWSHLELKLSQVYPQGRFIEMLRLIYVRLLLGFVVLLPVAFLLSLLLSHTVAGPLVRIKRYLHLMSRGEFNLSPLYLRRYDELKDVAELVNEITSRLGPRFQERRKLIESLRVTIYELRSDLSRLPSAGQEVHRKVNFLADTLRVLE